MVAITTLATLRDTITDYLLQDDIADRVDTFIELAETRINREVRTRLNYATAAGTPIPSTGIVPLPTGFLDILAHSIDVSPPFAPTYVPPNQFFALYTQTTDGGKPLFYTIMGSSIYFSPQAASGTYTYTMHYTKTMASILSSPNTNDLLVFAPDLYLYASLIEAEPFLVNDARVATWTQFYERSKKSLQDLDMRSRNRPGAVMRKASGVFEGRTRF